MQCAIEVSGLRVAYPGGRRRGVREAVRGLSFRVNQGETVGFIGPNGAGKSSTLKALMGFVAPTGGEIRLLGESAGSPAARARVGFLPEVALYYPWLTPYETLWLHAGLAGLEPADARRQIPTLLDRVGLVGRHRDRLGGFSKGMVQRVGIAQALLGSPSLLVLDEVSSGLDPQGRHELREILLERKRDGVTILFSSHELTEVAQLCDRLLMISDGTLLEDRTVPELLRQLRRYWVRYACAGEPPLPSRRGSEFWEAEFQDLDHWRTQLNLLSESAGCRILDAGEREGTLERYFLDRVAQSRSAGACS